MTTLPEFEKFVARASPGKTMVYYEGDLAFDRQNDRVLSRLADAVLTQYEQGTVEVFQRKIETCSYQYIVQKRKRIARRRQFSGCYTPEYLVE